MSEHGGYIYGKKVLYDFSANLNPLGMPQRVKNAAVLAIQDCEAYPDPFCTRLREQISAHTGLSAEQIVCGNGAADLIFRIISAAAPKRALIAAPTFSEYEKALRAQHCQITSFPLSPQKNFAFDDTILSAIRNMDMVILCTPNNPNGALIPPELIREICQRCEEQNTIFLCDECFLDFVRDGRRFSAYNTRNSQVVILKAFTKTYAMPGLRLGYALFGNKDFARLVQQTGQYWSVSVPAQAAGIAALSETDYLEKTIKLIETQRHFLRNELQALGFHVFPSAANFLLLHSYHPLDRLLRNDGILIRSCANYNGLDTGYFRIAVRSHSENTALLSALRRRT